jgi:hypothetical protein
MMAVMNLTGSIIATIRRITTNCSSKTARLYTMASTIKINFFVVSYFVFPIIFSYQYQFVITNLAVCVTDLQILQMESVPV